MEKRSRRLWSTEEIRELKDLMAEGTPARVIALRLGRTQNAIYSQVCSRSISLKPRRKPPEAVNRLCI